MWKLLEVRENCIRFMGYLTLKHILRQTICFKEAYSRNVILKNSLQSKYRLNMIRSKKADYNISIKQRKLKELKAQGKTNYTLEKVEYHTMIFEIYF